jgi:hypothetical protein
MRVETMMFWAGFDKDKNQWRIYQRLGDYTINLCSASNQFIAQETAIALNMARSEP